MAETEEASARGKGGSSFVRIGKYVLIRMVVLVLAVITGVYLTIFIANMGGRLDEIRKAQIYEERAMMVFNDPELQLLPAAERKELIERLSQLEIKRLGMDRRFIYRSFDYLINAISLNLGRASHVRSATGSTQVRLVILERLPPTLALMGTANLLLFFVALFLALYLSRHYGGVLDRAIIALAPSSAAPSWFYELFLVLIFAAVFRVLPFGGMVSAPPPDAPLAYALSLLRHMLLPVSAILIGAIFVTIYSWRTFFLIHSSEDYVEMAKAKGLSPRAIERRYVLRPTLPPIITSFALMLISMWMGSILLEVVFNWPGLGRLLYRAIGMFDTAVIVGSVVIYAYLFALTIFLLDIIYVILDPRVKIGVGGRSA